MAGDEQSVIVIELAKEFMELIRQIEPAWRKAYFRFSSDGARRGSNGSYASDSEVTLIDPFKHNKFFKSMNEKSIRLFSLLGKEHAVLLLTVDSNFDYDIKFEYANLDRWKISKVDGGTGIPEGI